ncbi:hypothetical protein CHT98_14115 (plasmid) [Azospirillum brasilense]|uniref:Transposase IS4-like domain-containing protein n=1 Tax=Azospirillum brasilense TaxID=192 RepID=A0A235HD23_AZOBR|nr:hypothetical protein CHT98_14115 [Azospirillum brasilense]
MVDSTGVKLSGPGEWLVEKHGTQCRWAWRKLHLGVDAETGTIIAATLTGKEVDDAAELRPLLDQLAEPVAAVIADGACGQEYVYQTVADCHPGAAVIVPPRFRPRTPGIRPRRLTIKEPGQRSSLTPPCTRAAGRGQPLALITSVQQLGRCENNWNRVVFWKPRETVHNRFPDTPVILASRRGSCLCVCAAGVAQPVP